MKGEKFNVIWEVRDEEKMALADFGCDGGIQLGDTRCGGVEVT
jgi:hypothetical protein